MGGSQPYLYNPPARYGYSALNLPSEFNPKAVTQASQAPPPPPRPKQEGPLLNFNRHPDSYVVLPYGNTNPVRMSPKTKIAVKWARHGQLGLRVLELIGAIGIFICVVCIRGATENEGWILRLPPGVDILTTLYAIYHLMRPAKGRTPASSASYHFFALFMDTGLIPFYVFTAMLGKANYELSPGTSGRWRTFFHTYEATNQLLLSTWLISTVDASLHLLSFFFDLYLVIVFRQISHLPPDMNPLEDNLTSRRKNKHQYKNSSVSEINEKRMSELTTATTGGINSTRVSQAHEPLIASQDSRGMSFFQSRNAKDGSFSPHNPTTARLSRVNLADPIYQQSQSARGSRADLDYDPRLASFNSPSRVTSAMPSNPTISKRNSMATAVSVHTDEDISRYEEPTISGKPEGENWAVLNHNNDSEPADYDPFRANSAFFSPVSGNPSHQETIFLPQPLRMNPPTPESQYEDQFVSIENKENNRTQTMTSGVSALSASSTYSRGETTISAATAMTGSDAPKTRFYGDLAAAMRGVRQHEAISSGPKSMVGSLHNTSERSAYSSRMLRPNLNSKPLPATAGDRRTGQKSYIDSVSGTVIRKPVRAGEEPEDHANYANANERSSPRVISRSGVDLMTAGADLGLAQGRREVSGKIVEEGRSGYRMGKFMRKSSGRF